MTDNPTPAKPGMSTGKMVLIAVGFFGVGLLAAYAFGAMQSGGTTEISDSETKPEQERTAPAQSAGRTQVPDEARSKKQGNAMGVQVPVFQFTSDVQAYMREVLNAPIPSNYVLPENILNQSNYDMAVNQVGDNYPMFKNKEGAVLVAAVQEYPYIYQELIREAKATREKFFPGSQPKAPL